MIKAINAYKESSRFAKRTTNLGLSLSVGIVAAMILRRVCGVELSQEEAIAVGNIISAVVAWVLGGGLVAFAVSIINLKRSLGKKPKP